MWEGQQALWEFKSLNVSTGQIDSLPEFSNLDAILNGWKKISISPRAILTIYTRTGHACMAQFFLKIDFLVQHMGTSP